MKRINRSTRPVIVLTVISDLLPKLKELIMIIAHTSAFSKVVPHGVTMTPPGLVCATHAYGTVCTEQVAITRS